MQPDATSVRNLLIALLDMERLRHANHNLSPETPLSRIIVTCTSDIAMAERALGLARSCEGLGKAHFDLQHYWLLLLGHRLAAERGLPVKGRAALGHVASLRLGLPREDTGTWSEDMLFEKYTETDLRTEWDYFGLHFRCPDGFWPPERI